MLAASILQGAASYFLPRRDGHPQHPSYQVYVTARIERCGGNTCSRLGGIASALAANVGWRDALFVRVAGDWSPPHRVKALPIAK